MSLVFPSPEQIGQRFNIVNTVPTVMLVLYVGLLLASVAPGGDPSLHRAVGVVGQLDAADVGLVVLATVALGLLVHPLQFALVRALEGYWTFAGPIGDVAAARATERHLARRERLNDLRLVGDPLTWWERRDPKVIPRRQQRAASRLTAFPHKKERVMPTQLGNALRRAEDFAGDRYGLDAIQWIPRLHPIAGPEMVDVIADARNQMDVALRFVLIWLVATAFTIAVLASHGPWLLMAIATYVLAWIAYTGGVHAARGYGETLVWAVDLYRFELVKQLHFPLPPNHRQEQALNELIGTLLSGERMILEEVADDVLGPLPAYDHEARSAE